MPRHLRMEYPGAIYDMIKRGDRREDLFRDDADQTRFLETLGEACAKTGWQVLAYCLMPNHFHLVVETPQGHLVAGMKWFLGVYTKRFNIRRQGDPEKVKLARRLRAETTMTLAWVAQHLEMGRWGWVSQLLKGKPKSANIKD